MGGDFSQALTRLNRTLPRFTRLCELSLTIYVLQVCQAIATARPGSVPVISVESYLTDFPLDAILGMANLNKITVIGAMGHCNDDLCISHKNHIITNDTMERLQAILELGKQIKSGFQLQSRPVVVEMRLLHGQNECHVEIMK